MKTKAFVLCLALMCLLGLSCKKKTSESPTSKSRPERQDRVESAVAQETSAPSPVAEIGAPTVLQRGVVILDGDKPLSKGSAPEVTDWNNDGKKDLLVGNFYSKDRKPGGNMWLFLGT